MGKATGRRGRSNVFADLLIADSDTHMLKAQLVARLQEVIRARKITQAKTAELIGVSQPVAQLACTSRRMLDNDGIDAEGAVRHRTTT